MEIQGIVVSLPLLISVAVASATMTAATIMWAVNRFQTKTEAKEYREFVDKRFSGMGEKIDRTEKKMDHMQDSFSKMAQDVSYIRGRLEPK